MKRARRTSPVTAGTVGCRTCQLTLEVPAATSGPMLWDFFVAHPAPCDTWIDVTGLPPRP